MTIKLICGHVLRLIQSILGVMRRVLCFMRKRSNIGELPYTVNIADRQSSSTAESYPVVPTTMTWDNSWDEKIIIEGKIEEWRKKQAHATEAYLKEVGPDFFNDMEPEIKKTRKVVIKRNIGSQNSTEKRNLFEFNGDSKVSAQLGELDDFVDKAWDDDIDLTLHEHRAEKHRARIEEHDRRMKEKRMTMNAGI